MTTFDDYLENTPELERAELAKIRTIIHQTVPGVEEVFSYGMPGFKYKDQPLIYFAAFKDHLSIFPTPGPIRSLQDKLDGYKIAKATIQFTVENPLPETIIKEILQVRLEEVKQSSQ